MFPGLHAPAHEHGTPTAVPCCAVGCKPGALYSTPYPVLSLPTPTWAGVQLKCTKQNGSPVDLGLLSVGMPYGAGPPLTGSFVCPGYPGIAPSSQTAICDACGNCVNNIATMSVYCA